MADNAFVKIGTALLKHQVKKLVGEETLGVIGEELSEIGGDKLDTWLGDKSTIEELEKAAKTAEACFHDSVGDYELEQWMVSLPIGDLPKVMESIEKLPTSPNEKQLEDAIRESVAGWRQLSPEQTDKAVTSFLTCLRSALLPIEKQTLMVIGRSVLRTEDKVDLLVRWFEQYIITGKPAEIKQLNPEPVDYWNIKHPYAMPPNFTGRVEERKMLADWLNKDNENRLFILRALGGFGKSALSWQWLTHDIDSKEWKKVLWWSFYEGDASFEHFIEETLKYLKLEVPQGQRPQVDELLKAMQEQKILLIMDGFERALRAYSSMNAEYQGDEEPKLEDNQLDCVNINAHWFLIGVCARPDVKSKILLTTRLTPNSVRVYGELINGCREEELTAMQKEDAVEFFHRQKIKGARFEIEAACAPYGYHPLSLRLLAGRILKDFENPADIVVAQKLKIDGDLKAHRHHILEVAYNNLLADEQKLLSTIACFRSHVELKTLEAIAENKISLNDVLHDLVESGLLHFDEKNKKFDLHPIVRRYAYERLTVSYRTTAHTRIWKHLNKIPKPEKIEKVEDLIPFIELYYHTVQAGMSDAAFQSYKWGLRIHLNGQFRNENIVIELMRALFTDGEDKLPRLDDTFSQSVAISTLAVSYCLTGQFERSVPLFKMLTDIYERDKGEPAKVQRIVATWLQIPTGSFRLAETNLRQAMTLKEKDDFLLSLCQQELAHLLSYCGAWQDSEQELIAAEKLIIADQELRVLAEQPKWLGFNHRCTNETYRALRALLMTRDPTQSGKIANAKSVIEYALRTLTFIEEIARVWQPDERDSIRAHWLLGTAYRIIYKFDLAEQHLSKALMQNRISNLIVDEANILLAFARLRYEQKKFEEAKSLADESLLITERCGYVLQGADVNLFLAQYALEQEQDKVKAKQYAEEAKKLATCDGPPYYYKVAYDEAERMLEKLKNEK